MVDEDLIEELEAASIQVGGISRLGSDEVASYIDRLADAYVADRKHLRWWESLKVPTSRLGYGGSDGLSQLVKLVENKGEAVLVVTDEEEPPWPVYTGSVVKIIEMLRGCRYFEYMIAAPDGSWVVFDTHMNLRTAVESAFLLISSMLERG